MITSRSFFDLDPVVQPVAQAHIEGCKKEGIDIIVTATYRDVEAQDALYAVGRTPGDIRARITNAKGGQSWHQFRCAWDVVPLIGGKCVWDDTVLWDTVISIAEEAGAEAGAKWLQFRDKPHFQKIPEGLSIDDAAVRFAAHGTIFIPDGN